jgi:hypothetical protein
MASPVTVTLTATFPDIPSLAEALGPLLAAANFNTHLREGIDYVNSLTRPAEAPEVPEVPEVADEAPTVASLLADIGRKATKQASLPDGFVVEGDKIVTEDGEVMLVAATARGYVIASGEDGVLKALPVDSLAKAKDEDEPETLPDDYLIEELGEVGRKVKKSLGVGKVLNLIAAVDPAARRISEVPPAKRDDLLKLMNEAMDDDL